MASAAARPAAAAPRRLNGPPVWLKPTVHFLVSLPLVYLSLGWAELLWLSPTSLRLSAEPVAYTHNALGLMALRTLLLSLAVTPVHRLTGWVPVMSLRRMLGLWAFAYAAIHLLFFMGLELDWSLSLLWREAMKRNFILAGLVAFLALLPLALTSTRRAIKAIGGKRWQQLHRLAYLAGLAAAVHFLFRVKGFQWEPWIYLGILLALFAIRMLPKRAKKRAKPAAITASRPPASPEPAPTA